MIDEKNLIVSNDDFDKLLEKQGHKIPQVGDTVKGVVVSASKAEVKLDINGIRIGVVRGPELYFEDDEYANLKPESEVEATVIDLENENGELELSFKHAGHEKAWESLKDAHKEGKVIKIRIIDANKGGLMARYRQIGGFLPVSQLAPENYPRVSGGDKGKILEKLKSFVGRDFDVKVITLDEKEDKIIFSEKDVWSEKQKNVISKFKVGDQVEGEVIAVTDFGVFVSFSDGMEGLIHISELAWQRIDDPNNLYSVGDKVKAEIISIDNSKIFLSAKKLLKDPWQDIEKKYKQGQVAKCKILKVNPFGLFVELDKDIHGLAHISQLDLKPGEKIDELFRSGEEKEFEIMTIEVKEHRLGLKLVKDKKAGRPEEKVQKTSKEEADEEIEASKDKTKKTTAKKTITAKASNKKTSATDKKKKTSKE